MTKKTRSMALILALVVGTVMLFSSVFVVVEAFHDCDGEHCQICYQIGVCENTLKTLSDNFLLVSIVAGSIYFFIACRHAFTVSKRIESLVTLKVKLLN